MIIRKVLEINNYDDDKLIMIMVIKIIIIIIIIITGLDIGACPIAPGK